MKLRNLLFFAAIAWVGTKLYNAHLAPMLESVSPDDSSTYESAPDRDGLKNAIQSSNDGRYSSKKKTAEEEQDEKALLEAATKGNKKKVEELLAKQVNVNIRDGQRRTPLILAVWGGYDDVVVRLLAAGANPELKDRAGNNAFNYAAGHGAIDNVRSLLQRTHSDDGGHYIEYATLIQAALTGDISRLPEGTGKLASVNRINPAEQAPLYIAAGNGALGLMEVLIERGAEVNITNANGQTPLYWAVWNNQAGAIKLLIGKGANIEAHDAAGDTALILATRNKSSDAVKVLLEKGADKYHANKDGQTAYIIAEEKGYKDLVTLLK